MQKRNDPTDLRCDFNSKLDLYRLGNRRIFPLQTFRTLSINKTNMLRNIMERIALFWVQCDHSYENAVLGVVLGQRDRNSTDDCANHEREQDSMETAHNNYIFGHENTCLGSKLKMSVCAGLQHECKRDTVRVLEPDWNLVSTTVLTNYLS